MKYSKILKELFPKITLHVDDLLLLESFQIKCLPDRTPEKEFAALLRANPIIHRFLISRYPPIVNYINSILKDIKLITHKNTIEKYCQELLWEIADLTIYNKYPDVFDANVEFIWNLNEIISPKILKGKVVIDVGAGSGKLAFMAAQYAKTIYAVEPATSFRQFIRNKAINEKAKNIYALDGFLDSIPLPDNSIDILMTSNAIGWNIDAELQETERVVKPNGMAIHIMKVNESIADIPAHNTLISSKWNYDFCQMNGTTSIKFKYTKSIKKFTK